jgi:hypothetical protein
VVCCCWEDGCRLEICYWESFCFWKLVYGASAGSVTADANTAAWKFAVAGEVCCILLGGMELLGVLGKFAVSSWLVLGGILLLGG